MRSRKTTNQNEQPQKNECQNQKHQPLPVQPQKARLPDINELISRLRNMTPTERARKLREKANN